MVGDSVYSQLKWEAGVHRVQRVPATVGRCRLTLSKPVLNAPEVSAREDAIS